MRRDEHRAAQADLPVRKHLPVERELTRRATRAAKLRVRMAVQRDAAQLVPGSADRLEHDAVVDADDEAERMRTPEERSELLACTELEPRASPGSHAVTPELTRELSL